MMGGWGNIGDGGGSLIMEVESLIMEVAGL